MFRNNIVMYTRDRRNNMNTILNENSLDFEILYSDIHTCKEFNEATSYISYSF